MKNVLKNVFRTHDVLVFLATMFLFGISTGLFMGSLNNFLAEVLEIGRFGRGVIEFLRELPGLGLILLLALLYRHSEIRIIRIALLITFLGACGLLLSGSNRIAATLCIVLWSTGDHLLMPVRQSIAIHSAQKGKEGRALGITGSFGNVGQVSGYYLVPLLFLLVKKFFPSLEGHSAAELPFKAVFTLSVFVLLAVLLFSRRLQDSTQHVKKQRLYIRKKYLRYYILEMFFGARKQVFFTFAPFVLILNYGASTELIATLYGVYSMINIVLNPLMGKLLDKVGYKRILICDAVLLIVICLLYGFSHHLFPGNSAFIIVCIVFVLDGMLFVVGMARPMYVKSVSKTQEELTATLSTGISINHLFSILIALLGGLLWERLGVELLFVFAAFFGVGALIFSSFLPETRRQ